MTADLEQRLAAQEDIRAIECLKWRYLRACDRQLPEAVRDCFIPEAVIDFEGFPLFENRDSFIDVYREHGCQPHIVDMHHGQNPIVELTGKDSAQGYFDLFFYQIDTQAQTHTQLAIAYDDQFVRRQGRWWIAKSVARRISVMVQTVSPEGQPTVEYAGRSERFGEQALPNPKPRN